MSALRLCIMIAGSLCSLATGLDVLPARAEVVVIDNRTRGDIRFSLQQTGLPPSEHLLHVGQVLPLEFVDKTVALFQAEEISRRHALQPNSIYSFRSLPGGVDLEKNNFPLKGPARRPPKSDASLPKSVASRKPPDFRPSRVIPLKILVDGERNATREKWEKDFRRTVTTASDVIERHCGLRFEVQSVDSWNSEDGAAGPPPLLQDFELKVDPRPAWLAIVFTAQLRAERGQTERHPARLFARHIVVRDWRPKADEAERVELLVHMLGHYLGAADSPDASSVMRPLSGDSRVRAQKFPLQFDAPNTLLLNLVADQIRAAGPAEWDDLPPKLQRRLDAIWTSIDRQHIEPAIPRPEVPTAKQPRPATDRYSAVFVDGTRVAGGAVYDWGRKSDKPLLNDRSLLDGPRPVRWLRDDDLNLPDTPPAFVEFVGGDRLPGKVVQYHGHEDGLYPASADAKTVAHSLPAHLLVELADGSVMRRAKQPPEVRMLMPWLRRIVWKRSGADRFEPGTLRLRSGGIVAFRSLRFAEQAVVLLRAEGVERLSFTEIAELHMPTVDPWQAYYQQLAVLSPNGQSRLERYETTGGLRVTSSGERFRAFDGTAHSPDDWIHMLQPAWSIDPLFLRHRTIWMRSYFLPTEVPLSILEPVASERKAIFSGAWDWQIDRNCRGGPLRSGHKEFAWGLGVHATSELHFELPAAAIGLRTRVALDHVVGRGGCARGLIFVDSKTRPPLFRSKLLIGSRHVEDTGQLNLDDDGDTSNDRVRRRRLILLADMAAGDDRPSGADPFDIRDSLNWIEPLVVLDRERLQQEVDEHAPQTIDAWAGWTLVEGGLRLVNRLDKTDARHPRYRQDVQSKGRRLALARSWQVTSINNRLLLGVSRGRDSVASQIEVRVNGEPVGRFAVPVSGGKGSAGRSIPLGKYLGQEIAIQVIQVSRGEHPQVAWQTLCVLN